MGSICWYGIPHNITAYQGTEFTAKTVHKRVHNHGIKQSYHILHLREENIGRACWRQGQSSRLEKILFRRRMPSSRTKCAPWMKELYMLLFSLVGRIHRFKKLKCSLWPSLPMVTWGISASCPHNYGLSRVRGPGPQLGTHTRGHRSVIEWQVWPLTGRFGLLCSRTVSQEEHHHLGEITEYWSWKRR